MRPTFCPQNTLQGKDPALGAALLSHLGKAEWRAFQAPYLPSAEGAAQVYSWGQSQEHCPYPASRPCVLYGAMVPPESLSLGPASLVVARDRLLSSSLHQMLLLLAGSLTLAIQYFSHPGNLGCEDTGTGGLPGLRSIGTKRKTLRL